MAQAIESIMAAGIVSMQVAQPPHQRVESTQYPSYRTGKQFTEPTTTTDKYTSTMETKMAEDTATTTTAEDITVEVFTEVEEFIREGGQTSNETTEVMHVPKDLHQREHFEKHVLAMSTLPKVFQNVNQHTAMEICHLISNQKTK